MFSQEDRRHIEAAQGWIGLGQYLEANEELEALSPATKARPEVLLERVRIYALAKKWGPVIEVGARIAAVYRQHPEFNYLMAQANAQTGHLEESRRFLAVPLSSRDARAWKLRALDDPTFANLW